MCTYIYIYIYIYIHTYREVKTEKQRKRLIGLGHWLTVCHGRPDDNKMILI